MTTVFKIIKIRTNTIMRNKALFIAKLTNIKIRLIMDTKFLLFHLQKTTNFKEKITTTVNSIQILLVNKKTIFLLLIIIKIININLIVKANIIINIKTKKAKSRIKVNLCKEIELRAILCTWTIHKSDKLFINKILT